MTAEISAVHWSATSTNSGMPTYCTPGRPGRGVVPGLLGSTERSCSRISCECVPTALDSAHRQRSRSELLGQRSSLWDRTLLRFPRIGPTLPTARILRLHLGFVPRWVTRAPSSKASRSASLQALRVTVRLRYCRRVRGSLPGFRRQRGGRLARIVRVERIELRAGGPSWDSS